MSSPDVSVLWPSPESMRGYLDAWARYAKEMEARAQTLEAMSQRLETTYSAEIAELKEELANCVKPREARIAELEERIRGLERYIADLTADRQRAMERLAVMLEITVSAGTTLLDIIAQAESLIAHTKQQFRESL